MTLSTEVKICESGKTLSGKDLSDFMLVEAAANYSQDVYVAGITDETTGLSFGLVEALRVDKTESDKIALYARINPNALWILETQKKQKLFVNL